MNIDGNEECTQILKALLMSFYSRDKNKTH